MLVPGRVLSEDVVNLATLPGVGAPGATSEHGSGAPDRGPSGLTCGPQVSQKRPESELNFLGLQPHPGLAALT